MASYGSNEFHYVYDSYGGGGHDSAPTQAPLPYSYDYTMEHTFFNYASPSPYYYNDYGFSSGSTMSYSVSASGVPKFLQHTPALSEFVVSYSTVEFNEPEFEEYDPTPYGGGYDLVATYGKPLPPSDQTCYPRSASVGTTSLGSVPAPVLEEEIKVQDSPAKEEIHVPPVEEIKVKDSPAKEEIHVPPVEDSGSRVQGSGPEHPQGKMVDSDRGEHTEGSDHYPWAWDGYETQSGYDSRAIDYCACCCHAHGGGGYCRGQSQPIWSANYIFGCSGYPYGQGRELGGNYPNPIFGYERHAQEQSLEGQVQYEEPSLLNISTYFL